jgi:acetolactate synthase-1/2/3 large subunit
MVQSPPPSSRSVTTTKPNRTVAALLVDYLELEGATTVFGVPGGALIYVMDELWRRRETFNFVICRHETGAGYIAHGYALVTGGLGVVLTTSGPSATNALTAAMNAQAANCAQLVITGEIPQQFSGQGYLQEGVDSRLDVGVIFRNAVEYSAVVSSPLNFVTLFTQALRYARSLPNRAAHISLPNNVAGACVAAAGQSISFPTTPSAYRAQASGTDTELAHTAFDNLAGAKRPLIFLGNGARAALEDSGRATRFREMVERFAIPVMSTADGKGIFPESHPLSLRNFGMTACQWPALYMGQTTDPDHFDALLVIGSSLGELATSDAASKPYDRILVPTTHFMQVDLDGSVIGREYPVTLGLVGEASATIDALIERSLTTEPNTDGAAARRDAIAALKLANSPWVNPEWRDATTGPSNPASLMRVINETVTAGRVFIDAGNCVGWSLHYLVVDPPVRYHSALDMGPMGFGLGAVIGGKMGAPTETCVSVVGDGAFMMHAGEISTAAQYGVGAVIVVLFDNDLGMVSQGMNKLFPGDAPFSPAYHLGAPDLAKVAEGFGADAFTIGDGQGSAEFAAALRQAIAQAESRKRPQVIVVHVDTAVMPPYGWPQLPPSTCAPQPPATTSTTTSTGQNS